MRSIRTRTLLAVMAIAVAAFVPAGAAHADGTLAAVCEFDGLTGTQLTPVQYLSNTGNFDFSGSANCVGEHNNAPQVLTGLALAANGTYSNIVCGTGTATGAANLTQSGSSIGVANFTITFAAGQGALTGTFTGAGPFSGHSGSTPGYVNISPGLGNNAGVPPAGPCITQFQVHGAFGIV